MMTMTEEIRLRFYNHCCSIPPLPKEVGEILSWNDLEKLIKEIEDMELKKKNILKKVSALAEELCKE